MRRGFAIIMILSLGVATHLCGTTGLGGKGLIYVQSARILPKKYLEFYGGLRFYGKIASFGKSAKAYTLWNVQGFTSFNYSASSHLECVEPAAPQLTTMR